MIPGTKRPQVTIHYAQTLDGRIATRTGHSQWISCPATLELAHRLRTEHDAVLVGIGTVLADNPQLTVRLVPGRSPARIIVDTTLRLPLDARVLNDDGLETIVATTRKAPPERREALCRRGATIALVEEDTQGRVDLSALLGHLGERGVESVLMEGGSGIITSALRQRLADRLIVCIAPKIIGAGIDAVGDLCITHMDEALRFDQISFTPLGEDMIFDGRLSLEAVRGW